MRPDPSEIGEDVLLVAERRLPGQHRFDDCHLPARERVAYSALDLATAVHVLTGLVVTHQPCPLKSLSET